MKKSAAFCQGRRHLVTTFFSGIVRRTRSGYHRRLSRKTARHPGIWVEETDAPSLLYEEQLHLERKTTKPELSATSCTWNSAAPRRLRQRLLRRDPRALRQRLRKGHAYRSHPIRQRDFYADFLQHILDEQNITPVYPPCEGVEITEGTKNGKDS